MNESHDIAVALISALVGGTCGGIIGVILMALGVAASRQGSMGDKKGGMR